MALVRWEPARELNSLQHEMNRLFGTFFDSPTLARERRTPCVGFPAMDLVETDDAVRPARRPAGPDRGRRQDRVRGQRPDDLGRAPSEHEERTERLSSASSARPASFSRSLTLPAGVDAEQHRRRASPRASSRSASRSPRSASRIASRSATARPRTTSQAERVAASPSRRLTRSRSSPRLSAARAGNPGARVRSGPAARRRRRLAAVAGAGGAQPAAAARRARRRRRVLDVRRCRRAPRRSPARSRGRGRCRRSRGAPGPRARSARTRGGGTPAGNPGPLSMTWSSTSPPRGRRRAARPARRRGARRCRPCSRARARAARDRPTIDEPGRLASTISVRRATPRSPGRRDPRSIAAARRRRSAGARAAGRPGRRARPSACPGRAA